MTVNFFMFKHVNVIICIYKKKVTAIISHSCSYYLFDLYSRDSRCFSVSNGTSVLFKLSCLQQVENYIEVIRLEYQGRNRQYFQLQFLETEVENLN